MRTHAIKVVALPEVLQATALLSLLGVCWAQQPHPNTAACPTLPGNLREIPPLDTPPATPPRPSRHIAPTVSNGGSSFCVEEEEVTHYRITRILRVKNLCERAKSAEFAI